MKDSDYSRGVVPVDGGGGTGDSPARRILVVDDDPSLREFNMLALVHSGYHVDAVEDGAVAWQALNAFSYDLMITDHNMPKMSGVELLERLHDTRMTLPVILATGLLPTHEFVRHPWLQPAAALIKPYTSDEMINTVKKVLAAADGFQAGNQSLPAPVPS